MMRWRRWAGVASLLICAYIFGAVTAGVVEGWNQAKDAVRVRINTVELREDTGADPGNEGYLQKISGKF